MTDQKTPADSLAARLKAEIRAEIEAGLAAPARVPIMASPAPLIDRVAAAVPRSIPAAEGRPELFLPENVSVDLSFPLMLRTGLTVAYKVGDSTREGIGDTKSGLGYVNANVNFAAGRMLTIDIRNFFLAGGSRSRATSIGSTAVVGDEISAGVYWVHPALLALLSGGHAPEQGEGITTDAVPFEAEGARFNALRIARYNEKEKEDIQRTVYDLETGLLLSETRSIGFLDKFITSAEYLARRELRIPWARFAPPDWVEKPRRTLTYVGGNTIAVGSAVVRQTVTLTMDVERLQPGVLLARIKSHTDTGPGFPSQDSEWEMVCAPAMLYPLWVSPAAWREMQPNQVIDEDPVTRFTMTFAGLDGRYGTLVEEGPLERTIYYYDMENGIFSGLRGERPYAEGMGQLRTETWLTSPL